MKLTRSDNLVEMLIQYMIFLLQLKKEEKENGFNFFNNKKDLLSLLSVLYTVDSMLEKKNSNHQPPHHMVYKIGLKFCFSYSLFWFLDWLHLKDAF